MEVFDGMTLHLAINWGIENPILSEKDNKSPFFDELENKISFTMADSKQ